MRIWNTYFKPYCLRVLLTLVLISSYSLAAQHSSDITPQSRQQSHQYQNEVTAIKQTFESQLFSLPAFTVGHYGLRMYRQSLDPKYSAAIWSDLARIASTLNRFSAEVHTPEQIQQYSQKRLAAFDNSKNTRTKLRFKATKANPEYLYLGLDLIGAMARADEYGLKHKQDKALRNILRRYDFYRYATNKEMIRAWAAQLANQVFWLQQLGEQDVVNEFIQAFRATYPDSQDAQLTDQQYTNKIYGLTHIIFAASRYYQYSIDEVQYQWIYDYYRSNIKQILQRTKEDVIAEVGISFLLAGKSDDPTLLLTQQHIAQSYDETLRLIPSTTGDSDLDSGEHRNVLAIMLLNWQAPNAAPTINSQPYIFQQLPYGLISR